MDQCKNHERKIYFTKSVFKIKVFDDGNGKTNQSTLEDIMIPLTFLKRANCNDEGTIILEEWPGD